MLMWRKSWIHAGICAGLLSMAAAPALGAPPEPTAQGNEVDRPFLKQALGVNELELRLGHLAAERAATAEVKAMGKKMIQKHTELGQQLSDLAKRSGTSGEAEMSSDQQATFARLQSQSGPEFDRLFKETVDEGHVKELAMYRDEVSRAASPQLRALAERRVDALQKSMAGAPQSKEASQSGTGAR
jgi:putative membrane protein